MTSRTQRIVVLQSSVANMNVYRLAEHLGVPEDLEELHVFVHVALVSRCQHVHGKSVCCNAIGWRVNVEVLDGQHELQPCVDLVALLRSVSQCLPVCEQWSVRRVTRMMEC